MSTHIMIDLETMASGAYAAITEIGAVAFDMDGGTILSEFSRHVRLATAVEAWCVIDPDTVKWWMSQEEAARVGWVRGQESGSHFDIALEDLAAWVKSQKADGVWSHGATFDLVVLQHAYERVSRKIKPQWHYRDARDTRTLFWLCKPFDPWAEEAPAGEVKHCALDDARRQARAVVRAVAHLKQKV